MSETNHPYGAGGQQSPPGNGYPHQEPVAPGDGPAPLPSFGGSPAGQQSGAPFGATPGAPQSGPAYGSAAPPTSASSAPPAPWAASAPSAATAPSDSRGPQTMSGAQAGAALRRFGIGNPLPTFVIGGLAYVVALLASLVVIVSAVLAVLTMDTGSVPGGSTVPSGGSTSPTGDGGLGGLLGLVGIPFQLVSLATFGSYVAELDLGILGNLTMGFRGLPLLITVAMAATGFFGARLAQRRWSSNGVLGAVLWSGISGLAVAIFAVIAARVTAFSYEDESMGMSLSMHSAGADMFFGTWALIGLPLLLGHLAGWEKPSWWPLLADLAAAPRLVLTHALTFALPVGLLMMAGGALGMVIEGDGSDVLPLLLALPIWGLTGLAMLAGMGLLTVPMHMNARGDVESFGVDRSDGFLWFFDLPWYVWIPMVLIALVLPAVIALLWHRDREIEPGISALVVSWAALPLAYAGCSVVLLALVWTNIQAEMGLLGGGLAVNVGLAMWLPVAAFFLGLLVEALARFGAPFVDRYVPGMLVNWFRRSARRRRGDRAQSPGQAAGVTGAR